MKRGHVAPAVGRTDAPSPTRLRFFQTAGVAGAVLSCLLVTMSGAAAQQVGSSGGKIIEIVPPSAVGAVGKPSEATKEQATDANIRYIESCLQSIDRGVASPGCTAPLYQSEIARLKEDALRTNNANLLILLGDAYRSKLTGIADIGQAYRWYLLAAVRGDARAMLRLSDVYKSGNGATKDGVKALGYARLAQRLSVAGDPDGQAAASVIGELAAELAAEEFALAERFASEFEARIRGAGSSPAPDTGSAAAAARPDRAAAPPLALPPRLPGMGAIKAAAPSASTAPATPEPPPRGDGTPPPRSP